MSKKQQKTSLPFLAFALYKTGFQKKNNATTTKQSYKWNSNDNQNITDLLIKEGILPKFKGKNSQYYQRKTVNLKDDKKWTDFIFNVIGEKNIGKVPGQKSNAFKWTPFVFTPKHIDFKPNKKYTYAIDYWIPRAGWKSYKYIYLRKLFKPSPINLVYLYKAKKNSDWTYCIVIPGRITSQIHNANKRLNDFYNMLIKFFSKDLGIKKVKSKKDLKFLKMKTIESALSKRGKTLWWFWQWLIDEEADDWLKGNFKYKYKTLNQLITISPFKQEGVRIPLKLKFLSDYKKDTPYPSRDGNKTILENFAVELDYDIDFDRLRRIKKNRLKKKDDKISLKPDIHNSKKTIKMSFKDYQISRTLGEMDHIVRVL